MNLKFLRIGLILAILAVLLGAFAAHGLKSKIELDRIGIFNTGVRYHFYHTFAILIAALLQEKLIPKFVNLSLYCFLFGIVCFSGSLYLLACKYWLSIDWWWLGPITPIGGVAFILGWFFLLLATVKK